MSVEIREVTSKKELKKFVKFNIELYKGNPYHVPGLIEEEMMTLDKKKNPAFEVCDAIYFLAYKDGKVVGRIAGMVNRPSNEAWGQKRARFGFVDFIDDDEVVDALFGAVEKWAREQGMEEIHGPMGFTDMDHEGMLIDGFDELGTMATIYNYPYYPVHMERMGYKPDVDWVEYRMTVPDSVPDKYLRIASLVERKYGFKTLHYTSRSRLKADYGRAIFDLINVAYDGLYGYSPLSDRQIDYYIDKYLGILRLDCISVVVDKDGKLVAFGISIPSFSRALQRSGGRLWPLGWYHLLKAIHGKNDVVDLMLVAVSPEYQNMGVNAMVFADLLPTYIKNGYKFAESNLELADNASVQLQWQYFERRQHRRRRAFRRDL